MSERAEFDEVAENYEQALNQGLSISGENKDYFAKARVVWLAERLAALAFRPERALDFGCGTGSAAPFLVGLLGVQSLVGVDVSNQSVAVAARLHGNERARFIPLGDHQPQGDVDLAFCNGVFHHIPVAERNGAVAHVWRSLRPGGIWAFWENNPYNLGTRWIMSRLPFDRNAVTLTPREAERLLRSGGFEVLRTDHTFFFPGFLRSLRPLERSLSSVPLGAQYLVLCRKSPSST